MKNKKRLIISTIIAIIVLLVVVLAIVKISNSNDKGVYSDGVIELEEGQNPADIDIDVEEFEDFVEPGKGNLDIDKIQGYTPGKNYSSNNDNKIETSDISDGKDNKKNDSTDDDSDDDFNDNKICVLSDENLTVESVGGYTGNYVEDGNDQPIKNVASLIVTNNSEKMLQVADITFKVNDTDTAFFRITNLLPGASVLVLEGNKREYSDDDTYKYGDVANYYLESTSLLEDKFEIIKENGTLTLKNKTNETYKKVYVYYKYARVGGVYMGGITYRVPFENIEAKAEVDSIANHFNKNTSRIIDVQIAEE